METNRFRTKELTVKFLKENPGQRFQARAIAEQLIALNPEEARNKLESSSQGLSSLEELVGQVYAEIASLRKSLEKVPGVRTTTDRPRLFYFQDEGVEVEDESGDVGQSSSLPEAESYPLLQTFLEGDRGLAVLRINERRSSGRRGSGSGHWLHPDLVAIEDLSQKWRSPETKALNRFYKNDSIKVWAFEVKRALTISNTRSSYFQAVSNSGWANFGYLVATSIDESAFEEIEVLFGVHGIGLIKLDVEEPLNSQVLIPARERSNLDWNSADRLAVENPDFARFLKALETLHLTGDLEMVRAVLKP